MKVCYNMKRTAVILSVLFFCSSCFLSKPYRKRQFTYTQNGQTVSISLVVPKGYLKQESRDTAGVTLQTFRYNGGALLYFAYLTDTTVELQPMNKTLHQPLEHRLGGAIYKWQDENNLYYREIRRGNLRFGYQAVPGVFEMHFDEATNFASLQKDIRVSLK